MFKWSRKKEAANVTFQGKSVHTNPPPRQRRDRNEARLARLRAALQHLERRNLKDSPRYKMLQNELTYRELQMQIKAVKEK